MIGEAEKRLVLETLESGWITTGERALELGRRIAALAGARHGLAVNSATGALHLALVALGVGPGDEVITSPYTFAACVNVIEHVGATPVLVDVEPDTLCIDPRGDRGGDHAAHPRAAARRLRRPSVRLWTHHAPRAPARASASSRTPRTRWARAGRAGRSARSRTSPRSRSTPPRTSPPARAARRSPTTTALAERMTLLSLHGMSHDAWKRYGDAGSWYYEVMAPGFKYNLSDVLAAIGLGQLERFDEMQRLRRRARRALRAVRSPTFPRCARRSRAAGAHARLAPVPDRARARAAALRPRAVHRVSCAPRTSAPRCTSSRSTSIRISADTLPYREGAFPVAERRLPARAHAAAVPAHERARRRRRGAAVRKIVAAFRR